VNPMQTLLIRHLEPIGAGTLLGQADTPLKEGDFAASDILIDRLYSSTLKRAKQTASKLFPKFPLTTVADFCEIDYGQWNGLTWNEIQERWPKLAVEKTKDWFKLPAPKGELWDNFQLRVTRAYKEIALTSAENDVVAIVAHAGVNSVIHSYVTGSDLHLFQQKYGEIIEI